MSIEVDFTRFIWCSVQWLTVVRFQLIGVVLLRLLDCSLMMEALINYLPDSYHGVSPSKWDRYINIYSETFISRDHG